MDNNYITESGRFDKNLYYKEVTEGANKIFTELFGELSSSQVYDIIQSFSIKQSNKSIFRKSSFGWIYFIKDEDRGLVKIGMTDDIIKRFSQLKTNYKFCGLQGKLKTIALCAVNGRYNLRNVEKFFHNMFSKYHNYMEWYAIDEEVLSCMLNEYIEKKHYTKNTVDGINIFLMNDSYDKLFQCNFTEEVVRKRLDPFYTDRIISAVETHSLTFNHNKLYDVFMNELEEIYLEGLEVDFKNIVERIKNKYLDLNSVFFEQVEKERNALASV